jgi:hypothetical protein
MRAAEAARRRRLGYRLHRAARRSAGGLVAGGVIIALLLAAAASAAAPSGLANPTVREQAGEAVGRTILALWLLNPNRPQGVPPPAPVVPTPLPGPTPIPTLLSGLPEVLVGAPGTNLGALVDRRVGERAPVWRSAPNALTPDIRLTANEPVLAARLLFGHSAEALPDTWAKEVEAWASPGLGEGGLALVGRWSLAQTTEAQVFAFGRRQVRTVRLRILSNHGSPQYTTLAEVALLAAG